MNKENILKVLEEANSNTSNLTDKQIEQYNSIEFKNATKLGGIKTGNSKDNISHMQNMQKKYCRLGGLTMGKIQGKKNVESGLISNLGKKMSEYNNRLRICPYCEKETRGIGYERWHGEKCKWKNNPKPIIEPKININKQIHTCLHCSKIIQGRNYFKWHGDNCKHKK
jgi:hypothetical protein